jgi:hypothetical protein
MDKRIKEALMQGRAVRSLKIPKLFGQLVLAHNLGCRRFAKSSCLARLKRLALLRGTFCEAVV